MEFLNNYRKAITQGRNENTYNLAWAKAIVELSLEVPDSATGLITIPLEAMTKCFLKYYWDLEFFFSLKQGKNPNKSPDFLRLVQDLIIKFQEVVGNNTPTFFKNAETSLEEHPLREIVNRIIEKKGLAILKKEVCPRFLSVGPEDLKLYKYTKGDDYIQIKAQNILELKQESEVISDVIHLRWAQLLEDWNFSPKIASKLKVITLEGQEDIKKRRNLNWTHALLELYNPGRKCFLCPRKLDTKIDVHHVLPFSFMFSDDLWNLVFTHKECNMAKSNAIPNTAEIKGLKERNKNLLAILQKRKEKGSQDIKREAKTLTEMEIALEHGYVEKFFNQIKL